MNRRASTLIHAQRALSRLVNLAAERQEATAHLAGKVETAHQGAKNVVTEARAASAANVALVGKTAKKSAARSRITLRCPRPRPLLCRRVLFRKRLKRLG